MFGEGFVSQTHTACVSASLCVRPRQRVGQYAQDNSEWRDSGFPFPAVQMSRGVHEQGLGVSAEGEAADGGACSRGTGQSG